MGDYLSYLHPLLLTINKGQCLSGLLNCEFFSYSVPSVGAR